jgi:hypothetical protein
MPANGNSSSTIHHIRDFRSFVNFNMEILLAREPTMSPVLNIRSTVEDRTASRDPLCEGLLRRRNIEDRRIGTDRLRRDRFV